MDQYGKPESLETLRYYVCSINHVPQNKPQDVWGKPAASNAVNRYFSKYLLYICKIIRSQGEKQPEI